MHKAMVLLDIHFTVACSANFVLWRWRSSAFRRSACDIDIVDAERGCGNIPSGCAIHNTMQCDKGISGKYDIADLAAAVTLTIVNVTRFHAEWHRQM
jgi:hypothetical protein